MILQLMVAAALGQVAPVQLAAPDLNVVNLEENRGALFSEHLAQQLTGPGISVVTTRQIGVLMGQERQRQLMGCSEDSTSCLMELANALGSDGVIVGSVSKLGTTYQVNVSVISGRDGKTLTKTSSTVPSEEAVLGLLTREAPRMAQELFGALRPGHRLEPATKGVRPWFWVPAAAGVISFSVGLGLTLSAWADSDRLRGTNAGAPATFSYADAQTLAADGQTRQTLGMTLGAVGIAAVLTGVAMAAFGGDTEARVVIAPTANGAAVSVGGTF